MSHHYIHFILAVLLAVQSWAQSLGAGSCSPRADEEKIRALSICYLSLDNVCMQGRELVVYQSKDAPLPTWQGTKFPREIITEYIKHEANADPLAPKQPGHACYHDGPLIRRATQEELSNSPQFSECIKPLLIFIPFASTYGEYFFRVPSFMRHLTQNKWLDRNM